MAEPTSAYLILGVDRAASDEDIRAAFKRLAVKWHPDKGGDPSKFAQLREAYDTLADVDRRAAHDREFRLHGGDAAGLRDAGTAAQSGSEMDMVRRFREGEFAGHDPTLLQANSGAAEPTNLGFGGSGIMGEIERLRAMHRNPVDDTAHNKLVRGSEAGVNSGSPGVYDVHLPSLVTEAVTFAGHGVPDKVSTVEGQHTLPRVLHYGQVLVKMIAAPLTEEELRVLEPSSWADVGGVDPDYGKSGPLRRAGNDGVGIVIAVAKNESGWNTSTKERPAWAVEHLEVKDWVVIKPLVRIATPGAATAAPVAPLGSWVGGLNGLWVTDESSLLKVPKECMGLDYLAYHQALATAYRLLEDYGILRLGDCIIQNAADSAVGVAVIQLCRMLKLSCINVLEDTPRFDDAAERLRETWGASVVLKDDALLPGHVDEVLKQWQGVYRPRLALDGVGAEAGERLALCVAERSPLVTYAVRGGCGLFAKGGEVVAPEASNGSSRGKVARLPQLTPVLVCEGQISVHTFNLGSWVKRNGGVAYVKTLTDLAKLVNSNKLKLELHVLDCSAGLAPKLAALHECMRVARGEGHVGEEGGEFCARPQLVLQLGSVARADELYFEVADAIKRLKENILKDAPLKRVLEVEPTGCTLASFLAELNLQQYLAPLEESGLGLISGLLALGIDEEVGSGWNDDKLRPALGKAGVKKVGHREDLLRALRKHWIASNSASQSQTDDL